MPNQFYVQPAGQNVGQGLAGIGEIIALGREKKRLQEEEETKALQMQEAKDSVWEAIQSGDKMKIAEMSIQHPEFRESIGFAMQQMGGNPEELRAQEKSFLQGVLTSPQNATTFAQQKLQELQQMGADTTALGELLKPLVDGATEEELSAVETYYALQYPEEFKTFKEATAVDPLANVIPGASISPTGDVAMMGADGVPTSTRIEGFAAPANQQTDAFRTLHDRAIASGRQPGTPEYQEFMARGGVNDQQETDTYEALYDENGNVIAQRNKRTNQVITDPRAVEDLAAKQPTAPQRLAAGYAQRTTEANSTLSRIGDQFTGALSRGVGAVPQGLRSDERQVFDQAARNFINATLRRESGAAIAKSEFDNANLQYIPQPGDSPDLLEQKRRNRETVSKALQLEAGDAFSQLRDAMEFEPVPAGQGDQEGDIAVNGDGMEIIVKDGMWVKK